MNHTANYHLSQWAKSDQVKMEDFNADNAKIDAALNGLAQTLTAHTSELARKGNCQVSVYTYTGNAKFGADNPTVISFPKGTFLVLIVSMYNDLNVLLPGSERVDWHVVGTGHYYAPITWNETNLSIYSDRNAAYQFNNTTQYLVLAFRKADDV